MRVQNQILVNLEKSELNEASRWKQLNGKRQAPMDSKYQKNIMKKLIPMLYKYGIDMSLYPVRDEPGYQIYSGYLNNERIDFKFINGYIPSKLYREGKYDMTVKIYYDGEEVEAGVIDLSKKDSVEDAFSLITMTIEDMLKQTEEPSDEEEKKEEEPNKELDDLANFRSSLSEQELVELGGE